MPTVMFKEWLPDLPELNNPGLLEARGCIAADKTYKSFSRFSTAITLGSLPADVYGAFSSSLENSGGGFLYAGTQKRLYAQVGIGPSFTDVSAATYSTSSNGYWRFEQFEDLVIATNKADSPQVITAGSGLNFSALSSAPRARQIGRINQFIVLGDLTFGPSIRWCGIGNPFSWPTPNSATAIAQQAGEQFFHENHGEVMGIASGDQYGLVFQRHAITRVTYVGGSVVFQFDEIDDGLGVWFPNATVQVGGYTYFISLDGIYRTNGVQIEAVGRGRVDRWFRKNVGVGDLEHLDYSHKVYGAVDLTDKIIYWSFPEAGSSTGRATHLLMYSLTEDRFTHDVQTLNALAQQRPLILTPFHTRRVVGFSDTNVAGMFDGQPVTAIFITGEVEPNPGGYAAEVAVKPLVDQSNVTIALGTRNEQDTTPSFSAETTVNSRSGFANFRTSARYHRARITIEGTFNAAQGLEFDVVPSGA